MSAKPFDKKRIDIIVSLLLFAVTVAYLSSLPRNLNPSDEAIHLYEAKRLLDGQVMYRDVFEIITPGWMYLMAGLFWLFGVDMATARIGMAVLHASTIILIGLTCRRLGVRHGFAWTTALAYLAVCQSAWPIASQHWVSTFLCVAVLFVLVSGARTTGTFVLAGLLLGCLIGVQQQRGTIMAVGVAAWLCIDGWTERRLGPPRSGRPPTWQALAALAAGTGIIVAPLLLGLIIAAGFEPVWRALVVHPLINYGGTTHCEWGHINIITAPQGTFTFPRVLRYLPLVFTLMIPRILSGAWRRDATAVRRLLLLLAFSLFSMASIAYFPDFIHIAFIAPAFFITIAESSEWLIARLPLPAPAQRAAGLVAVLALAGVFGWQLQQNFVRLWRAYPIARQTAFGRIDLTNATEAGLYDRVDALLAQVPSRQLYCYPIMAHLYLMADAHNPTRYGFFLAGYNSPDQVQEVVDVLKVRRLPYIVAFPAFTHAGDPVVEYLRREYEPIGAGPVDGAIFHRKSFSSAATLLD